MAGILDVYGYDDPETKLVPWFYDYPGGGIDPRQAERDAEQDRKIEKNREVNEEQQDEIERNTLVNDAQQTQIEAMEEQIASISGTTDLDMGDWEAQQAALLAAQQHQQQNDNGGW